MGRNGKMLDKDIDSTYLKEKIKVKWYQPEAFTPLKSYHICIMQDGNDYFQMGKVATLSDQLHEEGVIEDTIFVGIHYNDKYDRQDKYHPDGAKQADYMSFLVHEVIPMLDEVIPTHQVGGSRTLMGDSLAGTLALMTALKYPHTFGKVIMQSPYVDDTLIQVIKDTKTIDTIDIYHTIGNKETKVQTTSGSIEDFLTPNRELHNLLKAYGSSYVYHELDGIHTWKYWQQDLKRAMITMFGY
ncbi:esterase family protein [Aquibacillus halophilus]|uniref:Esterase family protein n=1 Tax=Aquibacillus halophilus TaxID=930132 RepID=A0A6A8DCJ4_9BACI|nr:alpha/beta hydrolase-fold protein [Aquibacillus halophilus]MRH43415.1 esterase family protein [Aquibacillus halophilus]